MKFTILAQEISAKAIKATPELKHFSLPEDRWLLARHHLWTVRWVLVAAGVYALGFQLFKVLQQRYEHSMLLLGVSLGSTFLIVFSGIVWMPGYVGRRSVRGLHDILRARNIYYCPAYKCRYNCTGIRGNTCPECGTLVPGLTPSE